MKLFIDSKITLETAKEIAIRTVQIYTEAGVPFSKSDVELISQLDLTDEDYAGLSQEANGRVLSKVTY